MLYRMLISYLFRGDHYASILVIVLALAFYSNKSSFRREGAVQNDQFRFWNLET